MAEFYLIYGLRIRSNLALPGLVSVEPPTSVDVDVTFGSKPHIDPTLKRVHWHSGPNLDDDGNPTRQVWKIGDSFFHVRYGDGTEFFIDASGTQVWATWPEQMTLDDTVIYFEGPIFGFVLRLRGTTCLHASSIAVDGKAIAIVGPAGAGKSTTAAVFANQGYPILSEDVVALANENGSLSVLPGYPRVRLWPDTFEMPYGTPHNLPRLTPNWDKRYLDLSNNGMRFHSRPLPLAAVYVLEDRTDVPNAPFVAEYPPGIGLLTLVTNTYTNYMLSPEMRAAEFRLLGQILNSMPVKKVVPHNDPRFVSRLCEVIIEDFQNVTNQQTASA